MGAEVTGVDLSRALVEAARRMTPQIDYRVGRAENLEFDDERFDLVLFSFNGIDCIPTKPGRMQALAEMARVLRPEGTAVFSSRNLSGIAFGWYKFMRPRKLRTRASQVLSGVLSQPECYLHDPEDELPVYHAWPRQVIADAASAGLDLEDVFSNSLILDLFHRASRSSALTRLADPWPTYLFRKTGRARTGDASAA